MARLLLALCGTLALRVTSTVTPISCAPIDYARPFVDGKWALSLNIGREDGTDGMPCAWAASGARLPLKLEAQFEELGDDSPELEPILVPYADAGQRSWRLRPLSSAKFIGMHGQERVPVSAGAAAVTPIPFATQCGKHAVRFWLDFERMRHHDVELPASRLFFFANAWDGPRLETSLDEAKSLEKRVASLERRKVVLDEQLARAAPRHPGRMLRLLNERRIVRDDLWSTTLALGQWRASDVLPEADEDIVRLPQTELALASKGLICIKQLRCGPFGWLKVRLPIKRTFYEVVGTFTMRRL